MPRSVVGNRILPHELQIFFEHWKIDVCSPFDFTLHDWKVNGVFNDIKVVGCLLYFNTLSKDAIEISFDASIYHIFQMLVKDIELARFIPSTIRSVFFTSCSSLEVEVIFIFFLSHLAFLITTLLAWWSFFLRPRARSIGELLIVFTVRRNMHARWVTPLLLPAATWGFFLWTF